jgi:hypothetical protein
MSLPLLIGHHRWQIFLKKSYPNHRVASFVGGINLCDKRYTRTREDNYSNQQKPRHPKALRTTTCQIQPRHHSDGHFESDGHTDLHCMEAFWFVVKQTVGQ